MKRYYLAVFGASALVVTGLGLGLTAAAQPKPAAKAASSAPAAGSVVVYKSPT